MGQCECNLCIWDVERGKLIRQIRGTRGVIHRVQFTHDGRQLLAAADGVYVYDAETGKIIGEPFQAGTRIDGMSLSADDRLLATSDALNQVRLWELAARREISLTVAGGNGRDVAFAPDGRTLAFIGLNGDVGLLDWLSEEIVGRLKADTEVGSRVVFSADGRRLATAGAPDSTVLIWDVADKVNRPALAVTKSTEAALQNLWNDLRDGTPSRATRAVWCFAAAPEQAVQFLGDVLRPIKAPEPGVVARLIENLGNEEFQVRDKASRELAKYGEAVGGALRKAKKGEISLEQLRRIDRLLNLLPGPEPGPEQLRTIRAVSALEQIGSPEARKVLAGLAAGADGARITQEAKSALERLEKRAAK
jgi:hypothetical protein